ncbi:Phd finger domain-containing protein [Scedosporium apiospermum]|uniref:Transcription factor BYE1 n=1 Tax=Pseudallescheria apiosperma TaxID=563466 RepID=A0A084FY82_PSEDA|nr:Phd finger domain-containing protein [Scedosporium apiospermum]KEZ40044.1 Phd finger domain-containing protein [Scedosporium apiospermum]
MSATALGNRVKRPARDTPDPLYASRPLVKRRRHADLQPLLLSTGEPEPRRSVRATKGQHTKTFDQLDQPIEAPKRRGKRSKKASVPDEKQEEPEEEIIRCVCGATEQDEDSGEPWIACDTCGAWQHNVCMGMSVFTEDLPTHYYCEQCRPSEHAELLEGMKKGEKPWEARRAAYEAEAEKKKKRGRRGRGKRVSDSKDGKEQTEEATPGAQRKSKSPGLELKKEKESAAKPSTGKRKTRDDSQDDESKANAPAQKLQKVSESKAISSGYKPPEDLAASLTDLPDNRHGPVKVLLKSLTHALGVAIKKGNYVLKEGETVDVKAEKHALQIERAVFDSHPNHKEYAGQCRTLAFNLKNNEDLSSNLFNNKLSPTVLAVMTSNELASKELQRELAEMKAKVEKQSILIAEEGPRVRRTHKGEEFIESDNEMQADEETPNFAAKPREGSGGPSRKASESAAVPDSTGKPPLTIDTKQSPRQSEFDIGKVFSSVKSPTLANQIRRPSGGTFGPAGGPGVDAEVDRLLQDETESPPYSPTEDNDPDVVWRGHLVMNSLADIPATIKYMGGANLAADRIVPWTTLIPKRLSVAGRIDQQKAVEYLCSLRYNQFTDVVVTSISPSSETYKAEFEAVYNYFVSKQRYGVIGDKGVANVRDTYLVPVVPGEGNHPEFMLNLAVNLIPAKRTEPMLLAVFVYRDDARLLRAGQAAAAAAAAAATPTTGPRGAVSAISPQIPQGQFPTPSAPGTPLTPRPQAAPPTVPPTSEQAEVARQKAQIQGQQMASDILGPLHSAPTVQFLLPMAYQMTQTEWEIIRELLESDPKAREDLQHLSMLLERHGNARKEAQGIGPGPRAAGALPMQGLQHPAAATAPANGQ